MDLEDLHDRLHRARPVTPAITAALKYHVNAMSTSICKNFEELKSIVADHGSEVTRQWSSLTLEQQRELLVDIWPGIPFGHAPDIALLGLPEAQDAGLGDERHPHQAQGNCNGHHPVGIKQPISNRPKCL